MTEKHVLVEHVSNINVIIRNTFQATQRIKFISFDVSPKYIVFGANSGGIYIFSREPCTFVKLIPSQHGPAILVVISENEENIAVANSNGLVVVVESCFTNTTFQHQVYSEHENQTVTALKWSGADLYCGDATGKVSVITLKDFLTKAIFQPPTACLMQLDSGVVQLDVHWKFLLVSTNTRTLLCDTETERYKQIGKKMRDGPFGCCFVGGPHQNLASDTCEGVKIFCARPGARLWQADFQANVIYTHQFKSSLNQPKSDIILWDDVSNELNISSCGSNSGIESFNFRRLLKLHDRFVLTFREDGFFIFDPGSGSLTFWSDSVKNIRDVKVLGSFLFIWNNDLELTVLSVYTVEDLVVKTLMKKQYRLCGQLAVRFQQEVEGLITTSRKIHLISILSSKLDNEEDADLLKKLTVILNRIKEESMQKLPQIRNGIAKSGIVTVANAYALSNNENELTSAPSQAKEVAPRVKTKTDVLSEQYRVYRIQEKVYTSDFSDLMDSSTNLEVLYNLLRDFQQSKADDVECANWCQQVFLKRLHNSKIDVSILSDNALNYAAEAFLTGLSTVCDTCKFPLPISHQNPPTFYETGLKLMAKLDASETFSKRIPYMYLYSIQQIRNLSQLQEKLPLLIQYSDLQCIKNLGNLCTWDTWDDALKLLGSLKRGNCLNCGAEIDITGCLRWKDLGKVIVETINATNAVKLLQRYSNIIPNGELDGSFYQYCIFSTAVSASQAMHPEGLCKRVEVPDFMTCEKDVQELFEKSVESFLRKKYLQADSLCLPHGRPTLPLCCESCNLPLRTPVIDDISKPVCGHLFHKICYLRDKNKCRICEGT